MITTHKFCVTEISEKIRKKNMLTKKATSSSKRETLGKSEKQGCLTMCIQKCVLQHFLQKIRKFLKKIRNFSKKIKSFNKSYNFLQKTNIF